MYRMELACIVINLPDVNILYACFMLICLIALKVNKITEFLVLKNSFER